MFSRVICKYDVLLKYDVLVYEPDCLPLGLQVPSEKVFGVGARRVQVPFEEVLGSLREELP